MLRLAGKLSASIQHPDVRKSLIGAAHDDLQVFPAQTHQTLAHRTAIHGNFRKELDKKQNISRQQQTHQGLAHEPRFGDNRTTMLIYGYIVVHAALLLHYYSALWLRLILPKPAKRGLQRWP